MPSPKLFVMLLCRRSLQTASPVFLNGYVLFLISLRHVCIVGDVINHGKHSLWGKPGVHYHHGMSAGQNTLNAMCTRVVMRGMAAGKGYDANRFLQDYIDFMTTPGKLFNLHINCGANICSACLRKSLSFLPEMYVLAHDLLRFMFYVRGHALFSIVMVCRQP